MTPESRRVLIKWLESAPWWKELPYAALEAKLEAMEEILSDANYVLEALRTDAFIRVPNHYERYRQNLYKLEEQAE